MLPPFCGCSCVGEGFGYGVSGMVLMICAFTGVPVTIGVGEGVMGATPKILYIFSAVLAPEYAAFTSDVQYVIGVDSTYPILNTNNGTCRLYEPLNSVKNS